MTGTRSELWLNGTAAQAEQKRKVSNEHNLRQETAYMADSAYFKLILKISGHKMV